MDTITENMKGRKSVIHVEENVVQVDHVTLNKPTDTQYQCRWIFDFSDVTRKELEIIASRGLVIKYRNPFKNAPASELNALGLDNQTFEVREILDKTPQRLDPMQKAKRAVSGLTEAQVEELLAGM